MRRVDERALKILNDTFWSSRGWKDQPSTPPADLEYARDAGYMFDPIDLSHDDVTEWVTKSLAKSRARDVADAFAASLSTRRLDWRSALGSYGCARSFPDHRFTIDSRYSFSSRLCTTCGEYEQNAQIDMSVMNFERHKWGGVRHDDPAYVAFDLEEFAALEKPKSTPADREILGKILDAANDLAPNARPSDLERALSPLIRSNRSERRVVIEILGFCGILQPDGHAGYFDGFPTFAERESDLPPVHKIDWAFPVCWWRGSHGVSYRALEHYFGTSTGRPKSP